MIPYECDDSFPSLNKLNGLHYIVPTYSVGTKQYSKTYLSSYLKVNFSRPQQAVACCHIRGSSVASCGDVSMGYRRTAHSTMGLSWAAGAQGPWGYFSLTAHPSLPAAIVQQFPLSIFSVQCSKQIVWIISHLLLKETCLECFVKETSIILSLLDGIVVCHLPPKIKVERKPIATRNMNTISSFSSNCPPAEKSLHQLRRSLQLAVLCMFANRVYCSWSINSMDSFKNNSLLKLCLSLEVMHLKF